MMTHIDPERSAPVPLVNIRSAAAADPLSAYIDQLQFHVNGFGHQHDDPSAETGTRIIGDMELIYYRGGAGRLTIGGQRLTSGAGDLVFIPPYTPHEVRTTVAHPYDNYWIHFEVRPLYERDRFIHLLLPAPGEYRRRACTGTDVERYCEAIAGEVKRAERGCAAVVAALLRLLVISAIRFDPPTEAGVPARVVPHEQRILDNALSYITGNLSSRIDVDRIVGASGVSRTVLFSLFGRFFGCSPMHLVRRVRIRETETLLTTSTLSVKEIADRVGFGSPSHLSRCFKEHYGVAPEHYRYGVLNARS